MKWADAILSYKQVMSDECLSKLKKAVSESFNFLKNSPTFKKIILPLIVALLAYLLTLVPVSENLENCKNCIPLSTLGNKGLVIYNLTDKNDTLFEYEAEPQQSITIHADNARLANQTLDLIKEFDVTVPASIQPINFRPEQNKNSKIFVKVKLRSKPTIPNALYLFRDFVSDKSQPDFKVKAEGLDLAVEIAQINTNGIAAAADNSVLKIGNWHTKLAGVNVTIIPEYQTHVAFRFNLPDWHPEQLFDAFSIPAMNSENTGAIDAQGIGIISETEDNQTNDSLLCVAPNENVILWRKHSEFRNGACPANKGLSSLMLTDFIMGKDHLQLKASGHAWVKLNGELTTHVVTYLKKNIENNPVLKLLFDRAKKIIEL